MPISDQQPVILHKYTKITQFMHVHIAHTFAFSSDNIVKSSHSSKLTPGSNQQWQLKESNISYDIHTNAEESNLVFFLFLIC